MPGRARRRIPCRRPAQVVGIWLNLPFSDLPRFNCRSRNRGRPIHPPPPTTNGLLSVCIYAYAFIHLSLSRVKVPLSLLVYSGSRFWLLFHSSFSRKTVLLIRLYRAKSTSCRDNTIATIDGPMVGRMKFLL